MQKLTYINLLNERLELGYAPFVLAKISGLGLPDVEIGTLRGAYQQGDTTVSARRTSRVLTVTMHLFASGRAELYRQRMRVVSVLSPDRAFDGVHRATLLYENDYGRWQTYAVPEGGLDAATRVGNVQPSMRLTFRCESPFWFSTVPEEIRFSYSGEGFQLPFGFPIGFGRRDFALEVNNAGQVAAPVEVWIEGRGETPSLRNAATGATLALASPLPEGSTLYLNTDPAGLAAVVTDATGAQSSAFGRLALDSPLADFTLRPGVNRLCYAPGGSGARSVIRVRWRAAFEGV